MLRKNIIFVFILMMLFTGCSPTVPPVDTPDIPIVEESVKIDTTVYYADETFYNLVKRDINLELKKEEDKYMEVLKLLMIKPENEKVYSVLNDKTIINSIKVENGLFTVDFTESLIEVNTGGSSKETMCLFSIVNTLCEFEEIDKVIFTVNGSGIETFGQFDMREPYSSDMAYVKEI